MVFTDIIGQSHIIEHLNESANKGRIPHAQLFVGQEGTGALPVAIAYAELLLCSTARDKVACAKKCRALQHPDLHFAFPVTTNDRVKKHPLSNLFLEDWRLFVKQQPYGSLFNWLQHIGVENKQGLINVEEAEDVVKKLKLKSYEGGFKIMIIWMAEKMNIAASNKLLKLIEEPPQKTVFLLVAEHEDQIINTIQSRCQALHFPKLSEQDIANALASNYDCATNKALKIAHESEGNYNKALHLLQNNSSDVIFEEWFVTWIRAAFKAKENAAVIKELVSWSETIAKVGRETQKRFLEYCLQFFRQALLFNYKASNLVFMESKIGFDLSKFAPFVHSGNIINIEKEISEALYHIERNGNAKIILLDLSMKLTRFLHKKEEKV